MNKEQSDGFNMDTVNEKFKGRSSVLEFLLDKFGDSIKEPNLESKIIGEDKKWTSIHY